MAKKQKAAAAAPVNKESIPVAETPTAQATGYSYKDYRFWLYEFKGQAIIVALLAFLIYCNTFQHEFAHDDGIVIVKNEFVLEGTKGISGIMTKDAYHSYYRQLNTTNQLKGGRFRPLSIITFALEQQFLGPVPEDQVDSVLKQQISYGVSGPNQQKLVSNMHVRHVFNVLWYMLSVVVLLYFFRYIMFGSYPVVALIAAVLFTAHPVHTEVVANVKSRDEIMSLLFMCLTFICSFRYEERKGTRQGHWMLAGMMLSYFLAFLSKEYAITVLALLPLALCMFRGYSVPKAITAALPLGIVVATYLAVRLNAISPPLEDNADINASSLSLVNSFKTVGTLLAGLAIYMFIRPSGKEKSDAQILISKALFFVPYVALAAMSLKIQYAALPEVVESAGKEVLNNPYLFATPDQKIATEISSSLYYLKFLFWPHPLSADYSYAQIPYKDWGHWSVALSILVHGSLIGLMLLYFIRRISGEAYKVGKAVICFSIAFYMIHLFMINNLVFDIGATLGERLIFHSSVGFTAALAWLMYKGAERMGPAGMKALAAVMVVAVGLMSFKTIDRNKAWKNDSTLFTTDIETVPNSVLVNANVAASYITLADYAETPQRKDKYLHDAIAILDHTLSIHPRFVAAYLNRGIAWFKLGDIKKAAANMDQVRTLYPTYPTLPGMYKLLCDHYLKTAWDKYGKAGKYAEAIELYKEGLTIDSTNADLWYNMGGAYYTNRQPVEALNAFRKALQYSPGNQQAQMGVKAATEMLNGGALPPPQPK